MMFYVGQKVVCVDADCGSMYGNPLVQYTSCLHGLKEKEIYTIRAIFNDGSEQWPGGNVYLEEIKRPFEDGMEAPYSIERFRPLVETDISIFEKMLVPTPIDLVSA